MRTLLLAALSAAAVWAQADNTITVSAFRAAYQADTAVISVTVQAPASASADDVLAVLPGSGITLADLSPGFNAWFQTVSPGSPTDGGGFSWTFARMVPIASMTTVIAALDADAAQAKKNRAGYSVDYSVSQNTRSPNAAACPYAALLSDARSQATALAAAAGVRAGDVVSISDGSDSASPVGGVGVPTPAYFYFASASTSLVTTLTTPRPGCSLVIGFALLSL